MKSLFSGASALLLTAVSAHAGGIERATNNYGLLFQDGNKIELSFTSVDPTVSGDYTPALGIGFGQTSTGDMSQSYNSLSLAYKGDLSNKLSFGLFVNQPYGANALYSGGFYDGLRADWDSQQLAGILKYQLADRVSVYGGARYVRSTADITIPDQMLRAGTTSGRDAAQAGVNQLTAAGVTVGSGHPLESQLVAAQTQLATLNAVLAAPSPALEYNAKGAQDGKWGYVLGAAYEVPDIAMRLALTWQSAITHEFDTTETLPGFMLNGVSTTEVEMPQTVALDFQTGIAKDTLVFGQIKWAEWSKWEVRTQGYDAITGNEVTGFENDTVTWKLGVGRRFNDKFSGFIQASYEKENGGIASRLAPTDGRRSIGIGGQYTEGNMNIRFGAEYVKLGDAVDASGNQFSGNDALGLGIQVTIGF